MGKSIRNLSLILVIMLYFSMGDSYRSPGYFEDGHETVPGDDKIALVGGGSEGPTIKSDNPELTALEEESKLGIQDKDMAQIKAEFRNAISNQEIEAVRIEEGEAVIIFKEPATISYTASESQDGYDQEQKLQQVNGKDTTIHLTDQDALILEEVESSLIVADYEVLKYE